MAGFDPRAGRQTVAEEQGVRELLHRVVRGQPGPHEAQHGHRDDQDQTGESPLVPPKSSKGP